MTKKIFWKVILITAALLALAACGGDSDSSETELPVLTGTVSITGTPRVGETLTANTTALGGTGTISYQWKRAGAAIGVDSRIYLVQADDAGTTLTVTVTRSGNSGSVTSAGMQITSAPSNITITVRTTAEWNAALDAVKNGGNGTSESPKNYTITVNGNVMVTGSTTASFGAVTNVEVTINGSGKLYIIGQGSLLNIGGSQSVCIDSAGLTLQGLTAGQNDSTLNNNAAVISMTGGTLELKNGTISGNTGGGGVRALGGSFTMSGGTISGNSSISGGGVYASNFTMTGGTISGNTSTGGAGYGGGGVYTTTSFTMSGGTISNNITRGALSGSSLPDSTSSGGGVFVGGSFNMTGGTISGNTCGFEPTTGFGNIWGYGGGVYVHTSGNFIMTGGTISNNTVKGGLILTVANTTIDMTNERHAGGGGVFVFYTGSFTKTGGGSITGNTALSGNAVCWHIESNTFRYRNTALGASDDISTNTQSGWDQ